MTKINRKIVLESLFSSIGIILFIYLIWSVKLSSIVEAISHINLLYFSISLLLTPIIVMVDTCRWRSLAKDQDVDLDFSEMVKIYTAGLFLSSVTPGALGAYIRAKLLHDKGKNLSRSISNVVVDVSMRTLPLHLASIFILISLFPARSSLLSVILFLVALSVLPLVVIYKGGKLSNRLVKSLFLPYISPNYADTVVKGVGKIFDKPPRFTSLLKSMLVTGVCLIPLMGLQVYMVSLSMGIDVPLLDIAAIWVVSLSITCLPISISGLGVREWSMAYMLNRYAIEKSTAITLSLLGYTVLIFIPAIAGAFFFIHHSVSRFRSIKKG